jgi:hypothetical protein
MEKIPSEILMIILQYIPANHLEVPAVCKLFMEIYLLIYGKPGESLEEVKRKKICKECGRYKRIGVKCTNEQYVCLPCQIFACLDYLPPLYDLSDKGFSCWGCHGAFPVEDLYFIEAKRESIYRCKKCIEDYDTLALCKVKECKKYGKFHAMDTNIVHLFSVKHLKLST